jgi:hypothetical protein
MYKPGILAGMIIILLITTSGCSVLSSASGPVAKKGISDESLADAPQLPDQYTAREPVAENRNTGQPAVVTQQPDKPVLRSAERTTIEGSGLTGNGTYNDTVQQIVTYLTNEQDYSNLTIVNSETTFWNAVASYVKKKIDSENTTTQYFTFAHVSVLHNGSYSVDQISDIWDYVMPPRWNYVIDPAGGDSPFGDHFNAASESIANNLTGDCDDFAILNAATTAVLGGRSRVVYATDGSTAHMYGEAQFSNLSFVNSTQARYNTTAQIWYHPGYWLSLDWFDYPARSTHPGGKFYPDGGTIWVMYKDGSWEKQQKSGDNWTIILKGTT